MTTLGLEPRTFGSGIRRATIAPRGLDHAKNRIINRISIGVIFSLLKHYKKIFFQRHA
jgi:hypothetical protein